VHLSHLNHSQHRDGV